MFRLTEHELIEGCIKKRQEVQKLLFDRYSGKMMSLCLRYAPDYHEAQDILQEGFIRLFNEIHQFRFEGNFEGWMRRVFVTVALRSISRRKMLFTSIDLSDVQETFLDNDAVSKLSENEIHAMIKGMPDGYRIVFSLHVIEGYSHDEIASMLQIQPTTSRGQLLKARKYLQNLITKKYLTVVL